MRLVVTHYKESDFVKCQFCDKKIAEHVDEKMIPSPEDCHKSGNVPIPNFGWFCSQECATKYEDKFDIKFARNSNGTIDYYADGF